MATKDAVEQKRNREMADAKASSGTLTGKRNRAMDDAMDYSYDAPATLAKRCRASDFHLSSVADT